MAIIHFALGLIQESNKMQANNYLERTPQATPEKTAKLVATKVAKETPINELQFMLLFFRKRIEEGKEDTEKKRMFSEQTQEAITEEIERRKKENGPIPLGPRNN